MDINSFLFDMVQAMGILDRADFQQQRLQRITVIPEGQNPVCIDLQRSPYVHDNRDSIEFSDASPDEAPNVIRKIGALVEQVKQRFSMRRFWDDLKTIPLEIFREHRFKDVLHLTNKLLYIYKQKFSSQAFWNGLRDAIISAKSSQIVVENEINQLKAMHLPLRVSAKMAWATQNRHRKGLVGFLRACTSAIVNGLTSPRRLDHPVMRTPGFAVSTFWPGDNVEYAKRLIDDVYQFHQAVVNQRLKELALRLMMPSGSDGDQYLKEHGSADWKQITGKLCNEALNRLNTDTEAAQRLRTRLETIDRIRQENEALRILSDQIKPIRGIRLIALATVMCFSLLVGGSIYGKWFFPSGGLVERAPMLHKGLSALSIAAAPAFFLATAAGAYVMSDDMNGRGKSWYLCSSLKAISVLCLLMGARS